MTKCLAMRVWGVGQTRNQPCAVFSRDTLLQSRWFLQEKPKGVEGIWSDILTMNEASQHIFIQRVLFVFDVNKRSAGRAQSLRMSKSDWSLEADLSCLAGYVLAAMRQFRDVDNKTVFDDQTIGILMTRFIEGWLFSMNDLAPLNNQ